MLSRADRSETCEISDLIYDMTSIDPPLPCVGFRCGPTGAGKKIVQLLQGLTIKREAQGPHGSLQLFNTIHNTPISGDVVAIAKQRISM